MDSIHSIILILSTFFCTFASAEKCVQHHIYGNDTWHHCSDGCCYSYIYPCCDEDYDFITSIGFRIGITVAILFFAFLSLILVLRRRQQLNQLRTRTVRHGAIATPNTTVSTVYPGVMPVGGAVPANGPAYDNNGAFVPAYAAGPPAYNNAYPPVSNDAQPPAYSSLSSDYWNLEGSKQPGNNTGTPSF